jgi:DNA invertase Pin-like site-specific DNA recombinase
MLEHLHGNGARTILVENASRFARDLAVQLAGHDLLKARGIDLIPADAPEHFIDATPTAVMVRQILGAVAQFEKAGLVQKLRHARERKRAETGRCEGPKPVPAEVIRETERLARKSPKTGNTESG